MQLARVALLFFLFMCVWLKESSGEQTRWFHKKKTTNKKSLKTVGWQLLKPHVQLLWGPASNTLLHSNCHERHLQVTLRSRVSPTAEFNDTSWQEGTTTEGVPAKIKNKVTITHLSKLRSVGKFLVYFWALLGKCINATYVQQTNWYFWGFAVSLDTVIGQLWNSYNMH